MSDDHVLINVVLPAEVARDPSPGRVAGYLGLAATDLKADYGVVALDKGRGLFSVMVAEDKFASMSDEVRQTVEGPFANPKIAPFGPVE